MSSAVACVVFCGVGMFIGDGTGAVAGGWCNVGAGVVGVDPHIQGLQVVVVIGGVPAEDTLVLVGVDVRVGMPVEKDLGGTRHGFMRS